MISAVCGNVDCNNNHGWLNISDISERNRHFLLYKVYYVLSASHHEEN